VDSRFQVQLEEDEGGSTGQSWMETGSLWTMIHWEQWRFWGFHFGATVVVIFSSGGHKTNTLLLNTKFYNFSRKFWQVAALS